MLIVCVCTTRCVLQAFDLARRAAVTSRSSLSELVKLLVAAVEAEFKPLFPADDASAARSVSTSVAMLVPPFKALIWCFRTVDSASASFCIRMHAAAAKVLGTWASNLSSHGITTLSRYHTTAPTALRSCAVDVLVTLAMICKVRSEWCC